VREPFRASPLRKFLAWCVHAYTASGLLASAGIVALLARNKPPAAAIEEEPALELAA